jgi:hypothetical protein
MYIVKGYITIKTVLGEERVLQRSMVVQGVRKGGCAKGGRRGKGRVDGQMREHVSMNV